MKTKIEKSLVIRYGVFMLGLAIMAFGCVLTIQAHLGVAPWEVFHIGLQKTLGLTIGIWSQIIGAVVIILSYLMAKIKPGLGTLLNMVFFGVFLDLFIWLDFIPSAETVWQQVLLFLAGMLILCYGIGLYISPRIGAGPRDSLMLALNEKYGRSIQRVRVTIEVTVMIIGWTLGGPVSIGTLLIAVLTGPIIQKTIPFWERVLAKPYGRVKTEQMSV